MSEPNVGEVWKRIGSSPWDKGVLIVDVQEGWVRFKCISDNPMKRFVEEMEIEPAGPGFLAYYRRIS